MTRRVATGSAASTRPDPLVARELAEHLAAELETEGGPGGVWLIRRLDIGVSVPASAGPARVATSLATRLTAELRRVVAAGPDGDNVSWYPDRAALLARYLVDRARGRGAHQWEYGGFGDDDSLPAAAAIVAQFTRAPEDALAALRRLQPTDVDRIIDAISAAGARDALQALASCHEHDGFEPFDGVIEAVGHLRSTSQFDVDEAMVALRIFVTAVRSGLAGAHPATADWAVDAARMVSMLRASSGDAVDVASAIAKGSWSALDRDRLRRLAGVVTWPPADPHRLVDHVRGPGEAFTPAPAESSARDTAGENSGALAAGTLDTHLGGMFLLLPLLAELREMREASAWPPLDGVDAARLAGYLTTISALGTERNEATAADPVLRIALRVPSRLRPDAISAWANGHVTPIERDSVPAAASEAAPSPTAIGAPFHLLPAASTWFAAAGTTLLRTLARQLPGFADSTLPYLWRNILDFAATVTIEPQRCVVAVANPPLHLLLTLTGLNRRRFTLAEGGPEWVLTQAM